MVAILVTGCQPSSSSPAASSPSLAESSPSIDPGLERVNKCFKRYDVTVYVGSDGKYRLFGDINRMQEVVDGECGPRITKRMHDDFWDFFAEVDQKIVEVIAEAGGEAEFDPEHGISVKGSDPDLVEEGFARAYDYYRVPRPAR